MAMNKKEQADLAAAQQRAMLLQHTVNPLLVPPSPINYLGENYDKNIAGFRVTGGADSPKVEKGQIRGRCWYPDGKSIGSQHPGTIYKTEDEAWLAAYITLRDTFAKTLCAVWYRYSNVASIVTDHVPNTTP